MDKPFQDRVKTAQIYAGIKHKRNMQWSFTFVLNEEARFYYTYDMLCLADWIIFPKSF